MVITGGGNPHMLLVGINTLRAFWGAVLSDTLKASIQQINNHLCMCVYVCARSTVFTSVQRRAQSFAMIK